MRFFGVMLFVAASVAFPRFVFDWVEGVGSFAESDSSSVSADVSESDDSNAKGILLIPQADDPQEMARLALENMDPMDLADVYAKFIRRANSRLSEEEVELIAGLYAEQEFDHGLPPGLLLAIGYYESKHQPKAVSNKSAYGVMQVQVPTAFDAAKRLGYIDSSRRPHEWKKFRSQLRADLSDPVFNIEAGAETIRHYLEKNRGDLSEALREYSCGATNYASRVISKMHEVQNFVMS